MMVENMMFNSLFLMQKNVLVYYKHQNGQLQLVVHLLHTQIKELLLAIQSLLMHLVHHIIVIYFMLHQEFSQGGKQKAGEQKQSDPNNLETTTNKVIFPITFTNNHVFHTFGIIASDTSIFWGNSGASVITRRISRTDMRYEVHSSYQTMLKADSIIEWCVVGI